jgi:hypothetical protein
MSRKIGAPSSREHRLRAMTYLVPDEPKPRDLYAITPVSTAPGIERNKMCLINLSSHDVLYYGPDGLQTTKKALVVTFG